MILKNFFLLIFLLQTSLLLGQGGGDCVTATFLCDKTNFDQIETQGAGIFTNEVTGNNCGLSEFNSTWFTWICDEPGNLTFDLIPSLNSDDVDFILYRLPSGVFNCDDKEIMRCMASSCDGATGLNSTSMDDAEQPGCSGSDDNYLEEVQLVAGEAYALFILSFSGSGIFDLVFGGSATFQAPEIDFTFSPDTVACAEEIITFTDQSSYDFGNIEDWDWEFGAGAVPATASGPGPHSVSWTTSGTKTVELTLTTDNDCTLDKTQTIIIENTTTVDLVLPVCENASLSYLGESIPAGQSATFNLSSQTECDTLLTVFADPISTFEVDVDVFGCPGTSITYLGESIQVGSSLEIDLVSAQGCDSIITVNANPIVVEETLLDIETCPDEPVTYLGTDYPPGTTTEITLANFQGCDSIIVLNIVPIALADTELTVEICEGESFEYEDEVLEIGAFMTFTLTSFQGCDSVVNVSVLLSPEFSFELDSNPFCPNVTEGSIEVINIDGLTGPFQFSLDGVEYQDEPLFAGLSQGAYTVHVVDDNGCLDSLNIDVEESERVALQLDNVILGCTEEMVEIRAIPLGNPEDVTLVWEDGSTGLTFQANEGRTYSVDITDACSTYSRDVEVTLETEFRDSYVYIPNGFSPNGDGANDQFQLFFGPDVEVLSFDFQIFNRWGANVYSSSDPAGRWNGTLKGKDLAPGNYVWFMDANLLSCRREFNVFEKGMISLIK